MTKQELIASAKGQTLSDEKVVENIKKYVSKYDHLDSLSKEELDEFSEVSEVIVKLRPRAMQMFQDFVAKEHPECWP